MMRGLVCFATAAALLFAGPAGAQNWVEMSSSDQCILADTGSVALRLGSYGAFGSAVAAGGPARYDPAPTEDGVDWPAESTAFESMAYLCVEGPDGANPQGTWLEAGRFGLQAADFQEADGVMTSEFDFSDVGVQLVAELNCNVLTECYVFTNNTAGPLDTVALTHYIDADLYFVGGLGNDYGGVRPGPPRAVYQFDQGDDPESPTTFIGLSSSDPGDRHVSGWEVGEFSEQRTRIGNVGGGCTVHI